MEEALEVVTCAPPAEVPAHVADEVVAAPPSPAAPEPLAQLTPPQSIALPATRAIEPVEQDLPQPPDDPLALVVALSEAERIALFT